MHLHTYLNFGGNCEEAFRFYAQHLGGKIVSVLHHGEMAGLASTPADWKGKVLHARIELGGSILSGADIPGYQPMRSAYLTLTLDSAPEAERIHAVLADGGEIFMPLQETFFAERFSMLRDRFGTSWMILGPQKNP
jgi:PhnB protein